MNQFSPDTINDDVSASADNRQKPPRFISEEWWRTERILSRAVIDELERRESEKQ